MSDDDVTAKRAPVKKAAAKKATAKKAPAKNAAAKKTAAKKATAKKTPTKKTATKKTATNEAVATEVAAAPPPAEESAPPPTPALEVAAAEAEEEAAPVRRRQRRPLLVAALVAVVVAIVVVAVRSVGGDGADSTSVSSGGGSGSAGSGAVPTPPASAPGQGSFIKSTVAADGSVAVQQWVRSNTPVRSLDVSVYDPESTGAMAQDVVVQALDGTVIAQQDSVGSDPVTLNLKTAVPNLYLSYQVAGGVDEASQTVAGRMLVTVLGMDVDFSGTAGGVQRLVVGPGTVSNVACLRVNGNEGTAPKPCGAPTDDGGWLVNLRGIDRSDRLLAQLESTG